MAGEGSGRPKGTVTFLFTDIEGSTSLWDRRPDSMRAALERHDEILRQAIGAHDGFVFSTAGDSFSAAFWTPADAIAAAVEAQLELEAAHWPDDARIRVRMGLHLGAAHERDGDYFGAAVNRAARVMTLAHGGQVLVSLAVEQVVRDSLPAGVSLTALGDHALRGLSRPETVFQLGCEGMGATFPPLRGRAGVGDEPSPGTPFNDRVDDVKRLMAAAPDLVGREADLEDVTARLDEHRLVTLVGPGGIGKTQLALSAGAEWVALQGCPLGIVELGRVRDDSSVVAAVATQLSVQPQQGRTVLESVIDVVGSAPRLIVLDNCEHVLDAIAGVCEELLRSCPGLRLLATSRAPLDLPGEAVTTVGPLVVDVPPGAGRSGEAPAVALFEQRARDANETFRLDDATRPVVAELCRRLDGLPLAIELAAARTRALSPAVILDRLDDRFEVLGSRRSSDIRQRSLRDLVEWSYQLLSDEERRLFRRLSVFASAFDLDAVEQMCCDSVLPARRAVVLLASLVDKSMVQLAPGGVGSYRLLETLRDFASSVLVHDDEGLGDRHRQWVLSTCEQSAIGLYRHDERAWVERLDGMFDDARLVVTQALERGDLDTALAVIVSGREYAFRRLRYELIGWAEAAIDVDGADEHPLSPAALGIVAYGQFVKGEARAAIARGEHAQRLAARLGADTLGIAERALGNAWSFLGTLTPTIDQLVAVAVASGEPARIAHAYYMRSMSEVSGGDLDDAATFAARAQEAAAASENPTALAQAALAAGIVAMRAEPERAARLLHHAETLAREAGNLWLELSARTETLAVRAFAGEPLEALSEFAEVIAGWQRAGDWAGQWLSLRNVFGICHHLGAYDLAAVIHDALTQADALDAYPHEPLTAARIATARSDPRYGASDRPRPREVARGGVVPALIAQIVNDIRAYTAMRAV